MHPGPPAYGLDPGEILPEYVENRLVAYRFEGVAEGLFQGEERRFGETDVAEASRMDEQTIATV
jgi:hypothetical protein